MEIDCSKMAKEISCADKREASGEGPKPFSVITESYQKSYNIPNYEMKDISFGADYDNTMCEMIQRHSEFMIDDRIVFIGSNKDNFTSTLERRFDLIRPVEQIGPQQPINGDTQEHCFNGVDGLFQNMVNVLANEETLHDRIIMRDSAQYLEDIPRTFANMMKCLTKTGRILIIYRPAPLNSLPYFSSALDLFMAEDKPLFDMIKHLRAAGATVEWDLESIRVQMPRLKWLAFMKERLAPNLNGIDDKEIGCGVRELNESIFKYEGDVVEFQDRLIFLSGSKQQFNVPVEHHQLESTLLQPGSNYLYKLDVTPNLERFIEGRDKKTKLLEELRKREKNDRR